MGNTVKAMTDLVNKYTMDFPSHEPTRGTMPQGYTVLITGTTGAIGSGTLAELHKSPNVTKIIALARASTASISVRQEKALDDRGIDPAIINSSKITLLEGDPALPGLGLADDVLLELKSNVTHIVHIGMRHGACEVPD